MLTVLLTVYNGAKFLPTAVESILAQTYRDFTFLIVDDASTDDSRSVIEGYRSRDPRIELLALDRNIGQTAALNLGLRRIKTPWMARMDGDDFSHPTRLEQQVEALEREPGIGCVGTGIWEFTQDPAVVDRVILRPGRHEQIRLAALTGSGMIHGSILVRSEAILECGGYNERYRYASDRDLFIRLFRKVRALNLQEPLLGVRRHPQQDSFSMTAAGEYVDLLEELLAGNGHSPQEKSILRRSLAASHLFRARCFRLRGDYDRWARDQVRALTISPETWARNILATAGKNALRIR
jgi:glycosyltransferase involved in cell wall biosynthesis